MRREDTPENRESFHRPSPHVSGLHSRGYLPHLKREGGTYFVTFRLHGTLPREVLADLKRERDIILHQAEAAKRPLTRSEHEELFIWYANRVDRILDEGSHGHRWLAEPEIARLVTRALNYFNGKRYTLKAYVVMSNHVHAVVRPETSHTLSSTLHSWKSFTASEANQILNRVGERFWQKESFDHLCRDDDDLARCIRYTINNPVKANLCQTREEWPWSSASGPPKTV